MNGINASAAWRLEDSVAAGVCEGLSGSAVATAASSNSALLTAEKAGATAPSESTDWAASPTALKMYKTATHHRTRETQPRILCVLDPKDTQSSHHSFSNRGTSLGYRNFAPLVQQNKRFVTKYQWKNATGKLVPVTTHLWRTSRTPTPGCARQRWCASRYSRYDFPRISKNLTIDSIPR